MTRRISIVAVLLALAACATKPVPMPPATPLPLAELFVRPVGQRGLEPTPALLALRGQRVLVEGYMVEEEDPLPGFFMLASLPVTLAERADGPSDLLPLGTVYVHLPAAQSQERVVHAADPLRVVGTLELGPWQETNGRISYVRVRMEELAHAESFPRVTRSNPKGATAHD